MVDRFLVWLGAGVVIAGVSAAVFAGSGVAMATEGDSADGGPTSNSETSDSAGNTNDPGTGQTPATGPKDDDGDKQGDDGAVNQSDAEKDADDDATDEDTQEETIGEDAQDETTDENANDETTGEDVTDEDVTDTTEEPGELEDTVDGTQSGTGSSSNDTQSDDSQTLKLNQSIDDPVGFVANNAGDDVDAKPEAPEAPESEPGGVEQLGMVTLAFEEQTEEPEFAAVAFASTPTTQVTAVATPTPLNILLDVIGTVIFGLYGFVIQLFGGPPMLPPGSTVTVSSSRLRLDCGCAPGSGESVPADWYIPQVAEGEDPPERLIYLQHGFLAAAPWYSYIAAALAEQTNSIVVAPSITSNFLKYDQCWLGGAPMHQAMAGLFADDNTALADSAAAAGYTGPIPDRVVLMGHSAGGAAVSGIAGYMTDNGSADRLAGVVLLDGVGMNGQMANDLKKVDGDIPIYQLAAPKYMWNMFGSGTDALLQARPDADFYGVTLAGGSHVDTMRGGNWLIQFSQQLVAGFSKPQNVAAADILMVGWVNDMFDGNRDEGIYLDSGETRTIDTPGGQATLVDLPNSLRRPYLLNFLEPFTALSGGLFTLQPGCLRESTGTAAGCTQSVAV